MADPTPCRNPRCETGDPVRTWLHPGYCGSACEWAHKVAMAREGPPIVHAAGRLPPEVEQAVTEQINRRMFYGTIARRPARAPTMADLMHALDGLSDPPEPIKVTRQEWEALKARFPASAPNPLTTGAIGAPLYGIPVEIVEPDPTPEPGWLKRWLRRLFR